MVAGVLQYITFLNPQNQPLYTCYVEGGKLLDNTHPITLELELAAYQVIDLVELTLAKQAQKESGVNDCFLGNFACCTPSPLNTFAYVSSTRLRVIAITDKVEVDTSVVKKLLKALAQLYAHTVANPFYDGVKLDTPKFVAGLREIIELHEGNLRVGDNAGLAPK